MRDSYKTAEIKSISMDVSVNLHIKGWLHQSNFGYLRLSDD